MDPAAAWKLLGSKVRLPFLLETITTCTGTFPEAVAVPAEKGEAVMDADDTTAELPPLPDPLLPLPLPLEPLP